MRLLIVVLAAVMLGGCASPAPVAQPAQARPAKISLDALAARHPFAPIVAQYDRDIATLERARGFAVFAAMHQQLNENAASIAHEAESAQHRLRSIHTQGPPQPVTADVAPIDPAAGITERFARALELRYARAHAYRAQQLREREATVALDFERSHLKQRLRLELRIRNSLYLEKQTGATLRAQLASLDAQERALVERQRRIDEATLAQYDAQIRAGGAMQAQALARDFALHRRSLRASRLAHAMNLPPDFVRPANRAAQTADAFASTSRDLTGRFAELRGADDAARAALRSEISALVKERDQLRAAIAASIESRAQSVAKEEGLGRVYTWRAPAGAVDITSRVAARMTERE